ncbi:hypothetical protein DRO54_11510 [Candidatus Bathyarchaeota archaeon]|nr:MAG: hypothetical protein DRO54_11510 [Candidatus Bathyarchaeota archaeon]
MQIKRFKRIYTSGEWESLGALRNEKPENALREIFLYNLLVENGETVCEKSGWKNFILVGKYISRWV